MTRVQRSQKRDGHSDVEKEGEITIKELQKHQRSLLKRYAKIKKHEKRSQNFFKSVAVVGYTNVGKSSLIKKIAKTHFESIDKSESSFEEHDISADKYFATLDIQGYFTDDHKIPFTLFDTVGLISDVPLELFDAFRETFVAAKEADVVVHVIDASSPIWKYHAGYSEKIFKKVGVDPKKIITVYNKVDKVSSENLKEIMINDERVVQASVHKNVGVTEIVSAIQRKLAKNYDYKVVELNLSFEDYDAIEPYLEQLDSLFILNENWKGEDISMDLYLDAIDRNRLDKFIRKNRLKIKPKINIAKSNYVAL